MRRGRRDPLALQVGDSLDFWRVEEVETPRRLRLRAEMKLPGRAWLEFQVTALSARQSILGITAAFAPKGLGGLLYWYTVLPAHLLIFPRLIGNLKRRAEQEPPLS
jgi:hypothetical protein